MPRGPLSAEAKAKMSRAAKKRWARLKAGHQPQVSNNGLHVESRLILHVQGHELTLTPDEARTLHAALTTAGYAVPKESA